MKKKKTPYLDFYKSCMRSGELPDVGLCKSLTNSDLFKEYFTPTYNNSRKYSKVVYPNGHYGIPHSFKQLYWAADDHDRRVFGFGPTRQTMVLFMAAMNNEL